MSSVLGPRYVELKAFCDAKGVAEARKRFAPQDYLDLQTLFNLAWIDPWLRENDPAMSGLAVKGRGYTEEDKARVLEKHLALLGEVIPVHRRLQDQGRIEVTTTPFFHPILPLLCDTNEARVAMPRVRLPSRRFQRPEDAREQVSRAVCYYEERFGQKPRGMWPAEGSVSPAAAGLFAEAGIEWIATDEEVLAKSIGINLKRLDGGVIPDPCALYTPYRVPTEAGEISIVFRDHLLSDLIGFQYRWADPGRSAEDFVSRIETIARACGAQARGRAKGVSPLVPVILDGENCWEFYREDGHPFLEELYGRLNDHPSIRSVTVSEYLDEARERGTTFPEIKTLHSGSWINHNFWIWIGAVEDNRSWDMLAEARSALEEAADQNGDSLPDEEKAWKEIFIAEGSDWNWWYGGEHYTAFAETFDRLYRKHLQNVYRFIGREPPTALDQPIHRGVRPKPAQVPLRTMTPVIDGRVTHFYEWYEAGRYSAIESGDAMHAGDSRVQWVYFGFDLESFYVRVDFRSEEDLPRIGEQLAVVFPDGESRRVVHSLGEGIHRVACERETEEGWIAEPAHVLSALGPVWEVAVPWAALPPVDPGESFRFLVEILCDGSRVERIPRSEYLETVRPTERYDDEMWMV